MASPRNLSARLRPALSPRVVALTLTALLAAPHPGLAGGRGAKADLNLSLNTGFDQARGRKLPAGGPDDEWRVVDLGRRSPATPANVVLEPVANWPAPLPRSAWISREARRGKSERRRDTLLFERCFCIGVEAVEARLDLRFRADDEATVYLNDVPIGAGGSFRWPPQPVYLTGGVGKGGPFRAGLNCLQVEVNDSGGFFTGLNLAGTVHAARGFCAEMPAEAY